MAEAIARAVAVRAGGDAPSGEAADEVFVASAGVSAVVGIPITPDAIAALRRLGIEHHGASKPLSAEMIRRADVIFGMTQAHVDAARRLVQTPSDRDKVLRLDPDADIDDPYGMGGAAYDAVARRLNELVPRRLAEALSPSSPEC